MELVKAMLKGKKLNMISIKDKKQCCGCFACSNACPKQCIRMEEDAEGFRYPSVNIDACINCGLCEKVCPVQNVGAVNESFVQKAFVVQNKDRQVLRESTSGGAFSAIAKWILAQGGVVFGVHLNDTFVAEHCFVEKYEDLAQFRNSKYVQSYVGDAYKQVKAFLGQGRKVLFSGTGCQLEGLFNYLRKPYDNLYAVDVICRATPSPLVLRKYLEMQKSRGLEINGVKFRDKYHGYKYSSVSLSTKNDKDYHEGIDTDVYLRAFFSGMSIRPSCTECKFRRIHRRTDMTIWDCFTVDEFSKELDNDKGATRIITHSNRAEKILSDLQSELKIVEVDFDKAIAGVHELVDGPKMHPRRTEFFADLNSLPAQETFEKWFPLTIRHRLEKQARLWSNRLGIYKIMKKTFKFLHGKGEIKR